MTIEEEIELLKAEKQLLEAENQLLKEEQALLKKACEESAYQFFETSPYPIYAKEYCPDLEFLLKNLTNKQESDLLSEYDLEGNSFQDPEFLSKFLDTMLDKTALTGLLSLAGAQIYENFLSLFPGQQALKHSETRLFWLFITKGLIFLYQEEEKLMAFVPREVQEAVKAFEPSETQEKRQINQEIYDFSSMAINLYGIIALEDLSQLYQHYHPGQRVSPEKFQEVNEHFMPTMTQTVVIDGYVAAEFFIEVLELFEGLIVEQAGKDRYIPKKKEEFFKYQDGFYTRETWEEKEVRTFLRTINPDPVQLDNAIDDLRFHMQQGYTLGDSVQALANFDYLPSKRKEQKKLLDLLKNMDKTSRKWGNKGYSDFDLHQIDPEKFPDQWENPSLGPAPGEPSKNGPCPCGSGKKYKRCCGK